MINFLRKVPLRILDYHCSLLCHFRTEMVVEKRISTTRMDPNNISEWNDTKYDSFKYHQMTHSMTVQPLEQYLRANSELNRPQLGLQREVPEVL